MFVVWILVLENAAVIFFPLLNCIIGFQWNVSRISKEGSINKVIVKRQNL